MPADVGVVPQHAVQLPDGWGMTQGRDNGTATNATDDLILSHFGPAGGKALETRTVLRGGHGDIAYSVDGHLVTMVKGVWSRITFGPSWGYERTGTPARCSLDRTGCQGEVGLGGDHWLRLYGESIKDGSERDPTHRTAFLQLIDATKVVRKIDLDALPRDDKGKAIGGRYEPEGVTLAVIDGEPWVLVGFSVGRLGSTTLNLYGRPLHLVLTD